MRKPTPIKVEDVDSLEEQKGSERPKSSESDAEGDSSDARSASKS